MKKFLKIIGVLIIIVFIIIIFIYYKHNQYYKKYDNKILAVFKNGIEFLEKNSYIYLEKEKGIISINNGKNIDINNINNDIYDKIGFKKSKIFCNDKNECNLIIGERNLNKKRSIYHIFEFDIKDGFSKKILESYNFSKKILENFTFIKKYFNTTNNEVIFSRLINLIKIDIDKHRNNVPYILSKDKKIIYDINDMDKNVKHKCDKIDIYKVDNIDNILNKEVIKSNFVKYSIEDSYKIKNLIYCGDEKYGNNEFKSINDIGAIIYNNKIYVFFLPVFDKYFFKELNLEKVKIKQDNIMNKFEFKEKLLSKKSIISSLGVLLNGKHICYSKIVNEIKKDDKIIYDIDLYIDDKLKYSIKNGSVLSCKINKSGKFDIIIYENEKNYVFFNEDFSEKKAMDWNKIFKGVDNIQKSTFPLQSIVDKNNEIIVEYNKGENAFIFSDGSKYYLNEKEIEHYGIGYDFISNTGKIIYKVDNKDNFFNSTYSIYLVDFNLKK